MKDVNQKYVEARSALIPLAMNFADAKVGKKFIKKTGPKSERRFKNSNEWANAWNVAYLGHMDTLCVQAGIV